MRTVAGKRHIPSSRFTSSFHMMGQLPGNVENMLENICTMTFHKASWSTHAIASYEISVPGCLLSVTVPPMHLPCSATALGCDSEGFCTVNVPVVVLEYARPNPTQSRLPCPHWTPLTSGTETECEHLEHSLHNASEVINLASEATHEPYSSKEVIDLTGED